MSSSIFSLTPTFTQGLILGQLSIFLLLALILKFLFFETATTTSSSQARPPGLSSLSHQTHTTQNVPLSVSLNPNDSTEWFNVILHNITQAYRHELKGGLEGPSGEEAARTRIERWVNDHRGSSLVDDVQINSISLGSKAPTLRSARVIPPTKPGDNVRIECDIAYSDDISASLSTSLLLHYPTPAFARLPVSLTMSLTLFSGHIFVTPPAPSDPSPCLTLTLDPSFVLDITTHSLLGSRAKLSDVPKVHEMITQRIRSAVAERGTWKILLPGVKTRDVVDMLEKKKS